MGLSLADKVLVVCTHQGREQDKTEMARWEQMAHGRSGVRNTGNIPSLPDSLFLIGLDK